MKELFCEKHRREKECLAGESAHHTNWYCPECELERQLAEAKEEIEAMRPMIEACRARYERHNLIAKGYPTETEEIDPCQCPTCQWYRDYLERKQS